VVYAGVDYAAILEQAEAEADVLVWDGGNNDTSFLAADVYVTVVDPHRAGHELTYYPGETNLRLADVVLVNKVDTAPAGAVERVRANVRAANPRATVIEAASPPRPDDPGVLAARRVLAVEDGPTLTHGGMTYGAGWFAAKDAGAAEIVDPVPYAVGSIRATYEKYPNSRAILPAMGYGEKQVRELEATIEATPADVVVEGTPIDLKRILKVSKPIASVQYELEEVEPGVIAERVKKAVAV
jgi:predicted GTPase